MQCISNYDQTRLHDYMHRIKCHIMDSFITERSLGFIKNNMVFSTGTLYKHGSFLGEKERRHMKIMIIKAQKTQRKFLFSRKVRKVFPNLPNLAKKENEGALAEKSLYLLLASCS